MYDTEIALDRNFMRRMIRAYEQDLLQLVNETPDHPGGDLFEVPDGYEWPEY